MRVNTIGIGATLALTTVLAACSGNQLQDARHPTGSSSIAASSDFGKVYVANTDAGSVAVATSEGVLARVDVGELPTRVARAGDLVFVTLRGEGSVAVLRESGDTLTPVTEIEVGADPVGVVASEDGSAVFVAAAVSDRVVEIDTASLSITRTFDVGGQPRWVALHPSGRTLYVGSAFGGHWSSIDLDEGVVRTHELSEHTRFAFDGDLDQDVILTPRITGDLSVSPDGSLLVVPTFFVDNTTPVGDPSSDTPDGGGGYSSNPGGGVGRTNPGISIYSLGNTGDPVLTSERTVFVSAERFRGSSNNEFEDFQTVRSYLSSTAFSPDGMVVLATMEGSEAIVHVPMHVNGNRSRGEVFGGDGFELRSQVAVATDVGPRGIAFLDDETAMVDTWLDYSVAEVPYRDARDTLQDAILGDFFMDFDQGLGTRDAVAVVDSVLTPEQDIGRRMFYRATDTRMAAHSGGISCATCHTDGRNDGVTWTFEGGKQFQTPSLAGQVSKTEPVTWTDDVASVAMEVRITSEGRMGGSGVTTDESEFVAEFIDTTPYPGVEVGDSAAIQRGREIFYGSGQCADCHSGDLMTDSATHGMFDLAAVRTPTLRGIAASAPYLHDGRVRTLEELIEVSEDGGMGKTNHLSASEKADLATYLKSL